MSTTLVKASDILSQSQPAIGSKQQIILKIVDVQSESVPGNVVQFAMAADATAAIVLKFQGGEFKPELGRVYIISDFSCNDDQSILISPSSKFIRSKMKLDVPESIMQAIPKLTEYASKKRQISTNVKRCIQLVTESPQKRMKNLKLTGIVTQIDEVRKITSGLNTVNVRNVKIADKDASVTVGLFRNLSESILTVGEVVEISNIDGNYTNGYTNFSAGDTGHVQSLGKDPALLAVATKSGSSGVLKQYALQAIDTLSFYASCPNKQCNAKKLSLIDGAEGSFVCDKCCNSFNENDNMLPLGCFAKIWISGTETGGLTEATIFLNSISKLITVPENYKSTLPLEVKDYKDAIEAKIPDDDSSLILEGNLSGKKFDILTVERFHVERNMVGDGSHVEAASFSQP